MQYLQQKSAWDGENNTAQVLHNETHVNGHL